MRSGLLCLFSLFILSPVISGVRVGDFDLTENWYTQTIDHFNWHPQGTFQQRYFVDDTHWQPKGPIFFYTGNEAPIETFITNTGFMFEIAPDFSALIVFAEHRYYGKSFPFGSSGLLPGKIDFLTVEQAMADFSEIMTFLKKEYTDSPIIVFGGSYGANLALWMRTKYPNLVTGAIASSATPLKHLLRESNAFYKIVTEVYANVSQMCPTLVRTGFQLLMEKSTTAEGRAELSTIFGFCTPMPNQDAANSIYGWISDGLETMVQYGYPYPTAFYNPVPGDPYKVACNRMVVAAEPLAALRAAADVYYNWTGEAGHCYNLFGSQHQHHNYYNHHTPTIPPLSDDTGTAWYYQTCTEVYQPTPMNGITDMYLPYTPNNTQIFEDCKATWGVTPRPDWEEMNFWGADISTASNIFLTNGQIDPWRSAGIQECKLCGPSVFVRLLVDAAHHLDLRASNKMDPPSVVAVRKEEISAIGQWIREWWQRKGI